MKEMIGPRPMCKRERDIPFPPIQQFLLPVVTQGRTKYCV